MGAIRLFLAFVVASDHLRVWVLRPSGIDLIEYAKLGCNAGYAVLFFYVISGFLISFVLAEKYADDRAGTLRFYESRFVRIFALYWPVWLGVVLFIPAARESFMSAPPLDQLFGFVLIGSDWRIALADYPNQHWQALLPLLHQAWSLGAELLFYLLAPFLLRSTPAMVAALGFSVAVRASLVAAFGYDRTWTYHFFPATALFFLLGHAAHSAGRRWALARNPWVGFGLLAGSVGWMLIPKHSFDDVTFWLSVLCFTAALPGVFMATKGSRILNVLGDLSYPVYLTHPIAMQAVFNGPFDGVGRSLKGFVAGLDLSPFAAGAMETVAFLVIVALVSAVVHLAVEKPMAHAIRGALSFTRRRFKPAPAE